MKKTLLTLFPLIVLITSVALADDGWNPRGDGFSWIDQISLFWNNLVSLF
jgi:hypothetical protein